MVIASDITRWGFVKADPDEFQEIFFEGFYTDYKSGDWRLIFYWEGFSKLDKRIAVVKGGFEKAHRYCSGPNDLYELLKEVGYLQ